MISMNIFFPKQLHDEIGLLCSFNLYKAHTIK